jgi:hypothetical protein
MSERQEGKNAPPPTAASAEQEGKSKKEGAGV